MSFDSPTLDGMPEPPPAWARPDEGVRMSAQELDFMLAAALPHAGVDEEIPALMAVRLDCAAGVLETSATDRYTAIRERRLVSQTCPPFTFVLRPDDAGSLRVLLKNVLRGLKDEARTEEPVDLALERTDDGPTLRVLGQDLDVRFTEHEHAKDFPTINRLLDGILTRLEETGAAPFDALLNPTLLSRAVALQKAGRGAGGFAYRAGYSSGASTVGPVVITPTEDPQDDVVMVAMPLRPADTAVSAGTT